MLFRDYLERVGHTLNVDRATKFFRWLVAYVEQPGTVKLLRRYGGAFPRATLLTGADGTRFVFGDNEPPVWCFTGLYDGEDLARTLTPETLLTRICICDGRGSGESNEPSAYNFRQLPKSWNTPGGVDHKHIFDVKERHLSFPPQEVTAATAAAQMLRYLSPMNHFLIPRYCTNAAERGSLFQAVAAYFMHERYGAAFLEFLSRIQAPGADELIERGRAHADLLELPEPTEPVAENTEVHDWRTEMAPDESLLRVLAPDEHAESKMTIGGDGRSFYTRAISKDHLGTPYTVEVSYRNGPGARIEAVGRYALNLANLLAGGYVRIAPQKTAEVVKLIVHERSGEFYIQLNQSSPSLRLPRDA